MFKTQYQKLEQGFINQVQEDNKQYGYESIYMPNIPPDKPVNFILVAMEPSLGRWAGNIENAQDRIESGFKNFAYSLEDFILHFCINEYLCRENESYHVTDISKGAMLTHVANSDRQKRYDRWYRLLKDEIELISRPSTKIISIGNDVENFLGQKEVDNHVGSILHYSQNAARYRENAVIGKEKEYNKLTLNMSLDQIMRTANVVLEKASMHNFHIETLERLRKATLSDSRKKLIFTYKTQFEKLREK